MDTNTDINYSNKNVNTSFSSTYSIGSSSELHYHNDLSKEISIISSGDNSINEYESNLYNPPNNPSIKLENGNINEKINYTTDNSINDKTKEQSNNLLNDIAKDDISIDNNEKLYKEIINNILQNYVISDKKAQVIEGFDNYIFRITTSDNEKEIMKGINDNSTEKLSKIDLGGCDNILKENYFIKQNDSLIIIIFEKLTNISLERSL